MKFNIPIDSPDIPLVATTLFGLENILHSEMQSLGIKNLQLANRAVTGTGSFKDIMKLNYLSRLAVKVGIPFSKFKATSEKQLYDGVYSLPWENWIKPEETIAIESSVWSNYFKHSQYAALKVKDAIVDRIRDRKGARPSIQLQDPNYSLLLNIFEGEIQLLLNTSGESLHKRGYKKVMGEAALSEILAAGIIEFSGWNGETPMIDPMCGSGTLLIEAAYKYYEIPSQWRRKKFNFENWDFVNSKDWDNIKSEYRPNWDKAKVDILGFDRSMKAMRATSDNLLEAKIFDLVKVDILSFENNTQVVPSTLVMNPPYDERLAIDDVQGFYQSIGNQLKHHWKGSTAWIITSNEIALKSIGLKPSQKIPLKNGPLNCKLQSFKLF